MRGLSSISVYRSAIAHAGGGLRCGVRLMMLSALWLGLLNISAPLAQGPGPFAQYAGRWVGEGRLGVRNETTEQVKCRVTYILGDEGNALRQSIRCASAGGSIEVQSEVTHKDDVLTGTWKELVHDLHGDIAGKITDNGFRLRVSSQNFNANMTIILKDGRQVIEIQFIDSPLIGLTLWLTQG